MDLTFGDVSIDNLTYSDVSIESSTYGDVSIESTTYGNVSIENSTYNDVSTESSTYGDVSIESSTYGNVSTESSIFVSTSVSTEGTSSHAIQAAWLFIIHVAAVVSLSLSATVSLFTVINTLFLSRKENNVVFWKRKMSQRLVVYLALCDFLWSIIHECDHLWVLITGELPPGQVCAFFGFCLQYFATTQSIIVLFAAVSAFVLVVNERHLAVGYHDWKLHFIAGGSPAVFGAILWALGLLGASEAWCMSNKATPMGKIADVVISVFMIVVFCVCIICYSAMWIKIKHTVLQMLSFGSPGKKSNSYHRSARKMSIIILAYLNQWLCYIVYTTWSFFTPPHPGFLTLTVVFVNLGGVYNFFAYTQVRKSTNSAPKRYSVAALPFKTHTSFTLGKVPES